MSDIQYPLEGGCACDAVRYQLNSKPMIVHSCHCRTCQRETGTSYALNAMIETDRIVLNQGETIAVDTPSESGKGQIFIRCTVCHVTVWSHYGGVGDDIAFLRVGTLDDSDKVPPDIQIYTRSTQPWVVLSKDIPAVEAYYDRNVIWSKESIERRNAIMKS